MSSVVLSFAAQSYLHEQGGFRLSLPCGFGPLINKV